MPNEGQAQKEKESNQKARADRILDVALALILRWGYNKTSIDDIARQADVAKGTIYLHWKSREALFAALLQRERAYVYQDIQRRIAQDPAGWTLRGMVKHIAMATIHRPLIKAILLGDRDVLGKLANSELSSAAFAERMAGFKAYLELLRANGLLRTDISLDEAVYIWSAALAGFFYSQPLLPEELTLTIETQVDLLAEMVHCSLELDRPVSPEEYQAVSDAVTRCMEQTRQNAVNDLPVVECFERN